MTANGREDCPLGRHRSAYQACLPEMQRLTKEQIQEVNLDVTAAVGTVQAASDRLSTLRDAAATALNDFDLTLWDKLETYAFALLEAHTQYEIAVKSTRVDAKLVADARQQFEILVAAVQGLVSRRLVDASVLKPAMKHRGPLRYAHGLLQLTEMLNSCPPGVARKTGLTHEELLQAEVTGERLAHGVALKNEPKDHARLLSQMRDRAFTLFVYAYGQVRRAVQYVRWDHNDADVFAPSLYRRHTRRGRARSKPKSPVEFELHPATAVSPVEPAIQALPSVSPQPVPLLLASEDVVEGGEAFARSAPGDHVQSGSATLTTGACSEVAEQSQLAKIGATATAESRGNDVARANFARRKRRAAKRRSRYKVARFRLKMRNVAPNPNT